MSRCEAVTLAGQQCTRRGVYRLAGRRVCGTHLRHTSEFVSVDCDGQCAAARAARAATESVFKSLGDVLVRAHENTVANTTQAAGAIEQSVREDDWLRRRRFWDRVVRT